MSSDARDFTRRPKNSPFFQQKLPAWQPMFTAKKSTVCFLVSGLLLVPLGAVLLVASNSVVEHTVDYTDCIESGGTRRCSEAMFPGSNCSCEVSVHVQTPISGPVYLYYQLENFYQNHRRYARSMSDSQLLGSPVSVDSLSSCDPYASVTNISGTFAFLPCGAVANSIFNDTFVVKYKGVSNASDIVVPMTNKGIAWKSDVDRKFGVLTPAALSNTVKPPNWPISIMERSPGAFITDEELMVWMRVAALPTFRKLHRIILTQNEFKDGLPTGIYTILINYAYPVSGFGGRKSFIIGNVSWLGGKNITLGVLCILTGSLHLVLSGAFLLVYLYSRRLVPKDRRSPPPFSTHHYFNRSPPTVE
ncbi:unnamed protein product [Dicrocoelium dendriticum]|nr:unnamed protein product [Dicrocoelium dendriticum]